MGNMKKFLTYLLTGQFGRIASAVRERIPGWLFRHGQAYIFELVSPADRAYIEPVEFPHGYQGRLARQEDMHACARAAGVAPEEYTRRFVDGEQCFAVFDGYRAVNLNWIHRGAYYVRGMGYLHNGARPERYIYGILTVPSERGKGLYKKSLVTMTRRLFEMNSEPLVQMAEADNAAVLHTLPKIGYSKTHSIRHISIIGIKYTVTMNLVENQVTRRLFLRAPRSVYVI